MHIKDEASDRIKRMRKKYLDDVVWISAERAKYYTESWKETENKGLSLGIRVALAMKNVYEKMTHYVDPDDRVAGRWTEFFLGTPIDIERGLFNNVLQTELSKGSMIGFQLKENARFLSYMVKKYGPVGAYTNIRKTEGSGLHILQYWSSLGVSHKCDYRSAQLKGEGDVARIQSVCIGVHPWLK